MSCVSVYFEVASSVGRRSRPRLWLLLGVAACLNACSWYQPARFSPIVLPRPVEVERTRFMLGKDDSIVGDLATVEVQSGDTLADLARHYGLGHEEMAAANPGLDVWAPEPGRQAVLPLEFVLPEAARKGIVVNLAAMRMFVFPVQRPGEVVTYPVGIGKEGRSTPLGEMYVARKTERPTWYVPESIRRDHEKKGDPLPPAVSPGPDNPLGEYAMYLSRPSYLIHGTNKPFAIGLRASNGCLRLYPENIEPLFKATPLKTPVRIVNQPYLLGWREGQLYLEAHRPHEELDDKALLKNLRAKLKDIEKKQNRPLDWKKIEATVAEERGIPVPIFEQTPSLSRRIDEALALAPPVALYGRPKPPPALAESGAWYIGALEANDELTARRTAAVLNHMGPQIPARTVATGDGRYRVIAGPFKDAKTTKAVAKRMQIDLDMRGEIVSPGEQVSLR
jgi:L,D-transpeptidase ErfK/SrfK